METRTITVEFTHRYTRQIEVPEEMLSINEYNSFVPVDVENEQDLTNYILNYERNTNDEFDSFIVIDTETGFELLEF